jgi:hypothetical protein
MLLHEVAHELAKDLPGGAVHAFARLHELLSKLSIYAKRELNVFFHDIRLVNV